MNSPITWAWRAPRQRITAQPSRWRSTKRRVARPTATAASTTASIAAKRRKRSARSSTVRTSGRALSTVSRLSPRCSRSLAQASKRATSAGSPATWRRWKERLPGWISWVAGRSAALMTSRGSRLKKLAPRSDSKLSTAAIRKREAPSPTVSPTRAPSVLASRSSSHSSPRAGMPGAGASGWLSPGAMRMLPRSGWPSSTTLTPASVAASPRVAMLVKLALSTARRPRRVASARHSGLRAWSATSTTSPPRSWLASSLRARATRSVKKPTLVRLVTAMISATSNKPSSPARRSRRSMRRERSILWKVGREKWGRGFGWRALAIGLGVGDERDPGRVALAMRQRWDFKEGGAREAECPPPPHYPLPIPHKPASAARGAPSRRPRRGWPRR